MRKVIYGINITLDGCVDHTKGTGDEDVHDYFAALMRQVDVVVYGRKTYELMVPFWPDVAKNKSASTKAMADFAQAFDAIEKIVVFSRTLKDVGNSKTEIVRDNLEAQIRKLKQEEGKDLAIGGVDLPSQLIELDLIDEFHFVVQPLVVGEGTRLFDTTRMRESLHLKLVESKVFKSGNIALRYVK